jgi:hypothetical protein
MNPDGSEVKPVTTTMANAWGPTWSPDSKQIAFTSARGGNNDIYVVNSDGGGVTNLTNDPTRENGNRVLAWSPDGTHIVYTARGHLYGEADTTFQNQSLGVASILIQTIFVMGLILFLLRYWKLPFGALTLILTLNAAWVSVGHDHYVFIGVGFLAGLMGDGLLWRSKPSISQPHLLRLVALTLPVVLYSFYFLALLVTQRIGWSIHLWLGAMVMAGIGGLLLSYLIMPQPEPAS